MSRRTGSRVLLGLAFAAAAGCSHGAYHRVRPGETLYRIGKLYGVSVEDLAAANRLAEPGRIEVGQKLVIPDASGRAEVRRPTASVARDALPASPARAEASRLSWPVSGGVLTSRFGRRGAGKHDGIDVSAPAGAPVIAAEDGEVAYSGALRGYGNLVIVRHRAGLSTVYAHNRANQVRVGQKVRRGDVVATLGSSGHTSGANLHFEVRRNNVARDPLLYLPAPERVVVGMRESEE